MSRALSVYHGRFGRATLYELNRPMTTHAHREGHLIFHLDGATATRSGERGAARLTERCAIAVNPWEPHGFNPGDVGARRPLSRALYRPGLVPAHGSIGATCRSGLRPVRDRDDPADPRHGARNRVAAGRLRDRGRTSTARSIELTDACFDQSWRLAGGWQRYCGPASSLIDFRVRKSMVLMSEKLGSEIELDDVARDAGLSRPHFYKLFRRQTGVTPNIYLNTLRMEKAIERIGQTEPVDHRDRRRSRLLLPERLHPVLFLACRHGADRLPARRASAARLGRQARRRVKRRYWRS